MTTAVKERGILFSAPMVRALLAGKKTQTRRIVKLREFQRSDTNGYDFTFRDRALRWHDFRAADLIARKCPYGVIGDRLWVRETWAAEATWDPDFAKETGESPDYVYAADGDERSRAFRMRWNSSLFMPRSVSRLTLVVKDVRVERLSEITDADAITEGVVAVTKDGTVTKYCILDRGDYSSVLWQNMPRSARECFLAGFRWMHQLPVDADPWLWVVSFERAPS